MKRKALEDEVEESPVRKKCRITAWQRHLQKYASTEGSTTTIVLTKSILCKTGRRERSSGHKPCFFQQKS